MGHNLPFRCFMITSRSLHHIDIGYNAQHNTAISKEIMNMDVSASSTRLLFYVCIFFHLVKNMGELWEIILQKQDPNEHGVNCNIIININF